MKAMKKIMAAILTTLTAALLAGAFSVTVMAETTISGNSGKDSVMTTIDDDVKVTIQGVVIKNTVIKGDLTLTGSEEQVSSATKAIYLVNVTVDGSIIIEDGVKSVFLSGSAKTVDMRSANGAFHLVRGTVDLLIVGPSASESRIYVEKGAVIEEALVAVKSRLVGRGKINSAAIADPLTEASSGLIGTYGDGVKPKIIAIPTVGVSAAPHIVTHVFSPMIHVVFEKEAPGRINPRPPGGSGPLTRYKLDGYLKFATPSSPNTIVSSQYGTATITSLSTGSSLEITLCRDYGLPGGSSAYVPVGTYTAKAVASGSELWFYYTFENLDPSGKYYLKLESNTIGSTIVDSNNLMYYVPFPVGSVISVDWNL